MIISESPIYIFKEDDFIKNYHNFYNILKSNIKNYELAYSVKTNYTPYILSLLKKLGAYAEVVSDMEYEIVKKVGYEDNKIIYNGPVKGKLSEQLLLNDGIINVDSINEIIKLGESNYKNIKIGLRLNLNIGQDFISRFGISDIGAAIKIISKYSNIKIQGLHFHISKSRSLKDWEHRVSAIENIISRYFNNIQLNYIDLGSGMFGELDKTLAEQFEYIPTYEEYAKILLPLNKYNCIIFTEPGTTLINHYIDLFSTVKDIKHICSKDFVVLDCCKYDLGEICELKTLPIKIINKGGQKEKLKNANFVGYTCLEHDIMYKDFNGELSIDDNIIFKNVGGYSNVCKPPFIMPSLSIITDKGKIIKRKESVKEVLSSYE